MRPHTPLESATRIGAGLSFIVFPLIFAFAFSMHPGLLHPHVLGPSELILRARGADVLQFGHALVTLNTALLVVVALHFMHTLDRTSGAWAGFLGAALAIVGALALAADKGALCLTMSALDRLPDAEFTNMMPGLLAMFSRQGWLVLLWGIVLLPVGFGMQAIALLASHALPRWQSLLFLVGVLLIAVPDGLEVVNLTASILLGVAFVPYGIRIIRRREQGLGADVTPERCARHPRHAHPEADASGDTRVKEFAMARRALLVCGVISSVLYLAAIDVFAPYLHPDYHAYTSQMVSELFALGAPTRGPLVLPMVIYNLLVFAFGIGVWASAGGRRARVLTAAALIGYGACSTAGLLITPMELRAAGVSEQTRLHIWGTVLQGVFITLVLMFGAFVHGARFRLYSFATIAICVVFGALASLQAAQVSMRWIGLTERVYIYAWMLWLAALALSLLPTQRQIVASTAQDGSGVM